MRAIWTDDRWEPQTWRERLAVVAIGVVSVLGALVVIGVFT